MGKSPISNGAWTNKSGDTYLVTGIDRDGKRFKLIFTTWRIAQCINVWCGSKWLLRNGRRHLIQRIVN